MKTMMGRKGDFVPFSLLNFDTKVPGANVQCREDCCLSYSVSAFVHAREGVQTTTRYDVQFTALDAKVQ